MRTLLLLSLLLLVACGGRVDRTDSFVERDVGAFWNPGERTGPDVQAVPGWETETTGSFSGNATGTVAIYMKDGRRELVLSASGPRGELYLSRDGEQARAIRLGSTGQSSYPVPGFADDEYNVVLIVHPDGSISRATLS